MHVQFLKMRECIMDARERLKLKRAELGLSQEQLGDAAGIGRFKVLRLESGRTKMDLGAASALAPVLGVRPSWLIFGEDGGKVSTEPVPSETNSKPDASKITDDDILLLVKVRDFVGATVGFEVSARQAIEFLANKAGLSRDIGIVAKPKP